MGLNYSLTGVFYNKELAEQIGMTEPPTTVAEFDDLLAKAKAAGLLPIMQWNATASGGGLAFPLQNLMAAYGPTEPINDWIFQKPGATIDTPSNLTAAEHLQEWVEAGYFPEDVNAIEYTDANARFGKGEGVFMFNGDWQNAVYDTDLPGQRRLLRLPVRRGGRQALRRCRLRSPMASPTNAEHADCAAFFFDWVATNETARQIDVAVGGSNPGGPTDLPVPPAAAGSVTNDTLASGADVARDNGAMDFIANATGSIFAQGWTPELQKLVGGRQDAAGLLKAVQTRVRDGTQSVTRTARRDRLEDVDRQIARLGRSSAVSPADPLDPGDPPANPRWLAVRGPGPRHVRPLRPAAARPDRAVLVLPMGRRRPGNLGRAVELPHGAG